MKRSFKIYYLIILTGLFSGLQSCRKFIDVAPPQNELVTTNVFNNDATAIAAMTGIYYVAQQIESPEYLASTYTGLSADEFTLFSLSANTSLTQYYENDLNSKTAGYESWNFIYPFIYDANAVIMGLNSSPGVSAVVKTRLLGEAKFVRAWFYFYLVNMYGDVPLVLSTNYKMNNALTRSPKAQVYQQIINDLQSAQSLLGSEYVDGTVVNVSTERVRPNKGAATALLARVYLYYAGLGNTSYYAKADSAATAVIVNNDYDLNTLNKTFIRAGLGNQEAIWQIPSVNSGQNTFEALTFVLPPSGPSSSYLYTLSTNLVNSFEPGDQRFTNWIGSVSANGLTYYFPNKYKIIDPSAPLDEYEMELRLGEQYLIRAEAKAQENNLNGAAQDLNTIRSRAGLANTTANTQATLLTAIMHERQVELFTEGHRWFDLKRTGNINAVMNMVCPQKGGKWNPDWALYPLPLTDIQADQNLKQNPGY